MVVTPPGTIRLSVSSFSTINNLGAADGWVDLHLHTSQSGPSYAFLVGVSGAQELHRLLGDYLDLAGASPPERQIAGLGLPGKLKSNNRAVTYFGQEYDAKVLQALGVLTMRVNLLDHGLIALHSALTGSSDEHSYLQYYASVNMKARIDNLRVLAPTVSLDDDDLSIVYRALDRAKAVSDRRNDLFHARWTVRNGAHRAEIHKPNSTKPRQELTVTEKMLLGLAEEYNGVSMLLIGATQAVQRTKAGL